MPQGPCARLEAGLSGHAARPPMQMPADASHTSRHAARSAAVSTAQAQAIPSKSSQRTRRSLPSPDPLSCCSSLPVRALETQVIDQNLQVARRLGLTGMPALIRGDGEVVSGVMPLPLLDAWLDAGTKTAQAATQP